MNCPLSPFFSSFSFFFSSLLLFFYNLSSYLAHLIYFSSMVLNHSFWPQLHNFCDSYPVLKFRKKGLNFLRLKTLDYIIIQVLCLAILGLQGWWPLFTGKAVCQVLCLGISGFTRMMTSLHRKSSLLVLTSYEYIAHLPLTGISSFSRISQLG